MESLQNVKNDAKAKKFLQNYDHTSSAVWTISSVFWVILSKSIGYCIAVGGLRTTQADC